MIKIDKLFGDKKGNSVIYILLALGVILLVSGNTAPPKVSDESRIQLSSREAQAGKILSEIKGVGEVSVMISEEKEDMGGVFSSEKTASSLSVLIVAEGGGDNRIREKIVRAASVALGAEPHKIEVFERMVQQ